MQSRNMGELQPTGRSKRCTHADNLALGNTDAPEQQAYTTTLRPREVVRPPMEVVARLTLTPWDQTLNYTLRTKLQPRCRGHHAEIISNCLPFGSHAGKQRPENVGAVVVVRLLAIYGGSVRLCCRACCGLCAVCGSPHVISLRGCADQQDTLNCCSSCFRFAFRFGQSI